MEKIAIITDSCSDIKQQYLDEFDLFVLPIQIQCGNETYRDGVDITASQVYQLQKDHVLKTSSPVGENLFNLLDEIKEKGYTHVIGVFLSGGLSGTSNQMRLFTQQQDDLVCHVIDSKNASLGLGMVAYALARYVKKGLSFEQLIEYGNMLVENTFAYFSIDDLDLLYKGGRIGKASALIGSTLKIKPILSFDKDRGEIYVPAKVRGNKKLKSKLIELVDKHALENPNQKFALAIADAENLEERNELEVMLKDKYPNFEFIIDGHVGAALSCYLGSGLLGAAIQFLPE